MRCISCSLALVAILATASFAQTPPATGELPRKGILGAQLKPADGGMEIVAVLPGLTAESGLKVGDVVIELQGVAIRSASDIAGVFATNFPGSTIKAKVKRAGKEEAIDLTVKERPRDSGPNYEVTYSQAVSNGYRVRVIITKPKGTSGKLPTLFLVQGIGAASMDYSLQNPGGYAPILKSFTEAGWATVRVEKPGLGDSEGGPFMKIDYERDVDAFRQTLKTLDKYPFIDLNKVVAFGHSMGGQHVPVLNADFNFAGIAVYGSGYRSWVEYMIENTRKQSQLAGENDAEIAEATERFVSAYQTLIIEGLEPAQAKTKYPQYARGIDELSPDGQTFSGTPLSFWRQCFKVNNPAYVAKINCPLLSMWGASDFISYREDHEMMAAAVNKRHPGKGEFFLVENSDHAFRSAPTLADSHRTWGQPNGPAYNPAAGQKLLAWAKQVVGQN